MKIIWDMDGTIADLYNVPNWLQKVRTYDVTPYAEAAPMWDMVRLARAVEQLQKRGIEICICSWLSKASTREYDKQVRAAKRQWLKDFNFPYDEIHLVKYGTPKYRYRSIQEQTILIDDNKEVRASFEQFENCTTVDPTQTNIIEYLENLAG